MFQEVEGTPKSHDKWRKEKRKAIRHLGKQISIIKHIWSKYKTTLKCKI